MRRDAVLRVPRLAVCLIVLLLGTSDRVRAAELLVFAAASLTDVLQELSARYEAASEDRVVLSFGATNDLARQIRAGAPADVFFAADAAHMEELERAGLVSPAARRRVLSNLLVVVVPLASERQLAAPRDLVKLRRIAVANPDGVPAGIYARTYLQSLGLWEALREQVVPTVDVRAALAAVETEHAEAAIVYRTDAAASKRVRTAFEVPREQGPRIVYTLAPLTASKHEREAQALVRYLAGPSAAPVYERHGFIALGGE